MEHKIQMKRISQQMRPCQIQKKISQHSDIISMVGGKTCLGDSKAQIIWAVF